MGRPNQACCCWQASPRPVIAGCPARLRRRPPACDPRRHRYPRASGGSKDDERPRRPRRPLSSGSTWSVGWVVPSRDIAGKLDSRSRRTERGWRRSEAPSPHRVSRCGTPACSGPADRRVDTERGRRQQHPGRAPSRACQGGSGEGAVDRPAGKHHAVGGGGGRRPRPPPRPPGWWTHRPQPGGARPDRRPLGWRPPAVRDRPAPSLWRPSCRTLRAVRRRSALRRRAHAPVLPKEMAWSIIRRSRSTHRPTSLAPTARAKGVDLLVLT